MNLYKLHSNPEELDGHDTIGKHMEDSGTVVYRNEKGEVHRDDDKPAAIYPDGKKEWWVNDRLHRDNDLPAVIYPNGDREWWVNDELHRDNDKPAVMYANGIKYWYKNGEEYKP